MGRKWACYTVTGSCEREIADDRGFSPAGIASHASRYACCLCRIKVRPLKVVIPSAASNLVFDQRRARQIPRCARNDKSSARAVVLPFKKAALAAVFAE